MHRQSSIPFNQSGIGVRAITMTAKTAPANAACAALDSIRWDGLVGTIAGDDTILLVMKYTESAQGITEELNKLAQ